MLLKYLRSIGINYYSPDDGGTLEDSALNSDGILDILNNDDGSEVLEPEGEESKVKGKEKEDKEEIEGKEDDDKEKKEIRLEEEEPEIDEDELEYNHVSVKAIEGKYPNFFKDFPGVRKEIFKSQQYAELYPTIQEAKDSKEKVDNYDALEESLLGGSIEGVLKSVKDASSESYEKIVENFLPSLERVAPGSRNVIIAQVIKSSAISMWNEGKQRGNENLQLAAKILHEFAFGKGNISQYEPKYKTDEKPDKRAEELSNREQAFIKSQFDTAITEVSGKVENIVRSTVDKHIDPRGRMTPYVKKNATEDIVRQLDSAIKSDSHFSRVLDKLWERSLDSDFSSESKQKIRNMILQKAQELLPSILRRVRSEALKGGSNKSNEDDEVLIDTKKPDKERRTATPNKSTNTGNREGKKDGAGMKTVDFFMQD